MEILIQEALPFLSEITIHYRDQSATINNVLIDCGSAGTAAETDFLIDIGILEDDPRDQWLSLRGIGGVERVRQKIVDITLEISPSMTFHCKWGHLGMGMTLMVLLDLTFL